MNRIRRLTALGVLLLAATACTPQEVAFWRTFHDERPAEAKQLLNELGLTDVAVAEDTAVRDPDPASPVVAPEPVAAPVVDRRPTRFSYAASVSCGPPTLTLTNTGGETVYYTVIYGPHQDPLVTAAVSDVYPYAGPPPLGPGATASIDLTPAIGTTTWIALDQGWATGGIVASVDVFDC